MVCQPRNLWGGVILSTGMRIRDHCQMEDIKLNPPQQESRTAKAARTRGRIPIIRVLSFSVSRTGRRSRLHRISNTLHLRQHSMGIIHLFSSSSSRRTNNPNTCHLVMSLPHHLLVLLLRAHTRLTQTLATHIPQVQEVTHKIRGLGNTVTASPRARMIHGLG